MSAVSTSPRRGTIVRGRVVLPIVTTIIVATAGCVGDSSQTTPGPDASVSPGDAGADTGSPEGGSQPCTWDQTNRDTCVWQ